ncbi:MAG: hypothetical protein H0X37_23970 [Herpetosiphonaceae bacterium]|nr:hypothetical protein [Herpetosiphonaceae bacterium]
MKITPNERQIYARGMKAKYARYICAFVAVIGPLFLSPVIVSNPIIWVAWGVVWLMLAKLWSERWQVYQLLQKYDQHIEALERAAARTNGRLD